MRPVTILLLCSVVGVTPSSSYCSTSYEYPLQGSYDLQYVSRATQPLVSNWNNTGGTVISI